MKKEKQYPPKLPLRFFRWYCHPKLRDSIEGDLIELYDERIKESGKRKADIKFVIDVILLFRPGIIRPTEGYRNLNQYGMFKNYFKTGIRNILKYRVFSFINVFGLGLGMSVCLLLIILMKDAHSYDKFHDDRERIYRINTEALRKGGGTEPYASSPYPVAEMLAKDCPAIETWAPVNSGIQTELILNNQRFGAHVQFTSKAFFDVFNFSLRSGNPANALEGPNSIILSDELAQKLFPIGDALDKTIEMGNKGLFKITGVLNKPVGKTHLDFEALASISSIPILEKNDIISSTLSNWQNYYTNYSYIKLKPNATPESVENVLASISQLNYKDKVLESRDAGYRFYLQPLNEITPGPLLSNSSSKGIPAIVLWFLGALAGMIMISSIFNYVSLTIARASTRMKEFAMRKVAGGKRSSIFIQIVVESMLMALLSLILGFVFLRIIVLRISTMSFINSLNIDFSVRPLIMVVFIGFAILVGLVGSILPGLTLSGIKPVALFGKLQNTRLPGRVGVRNALLFFQILLCLVFVNLIYITKQQMKYSMEINFGAQNSQVFNIDLQGQSYEKAVERFKQVPGIENISAISHLMGNFSDYSDDVRIAVEKERISVRGYFIDDQYIRNMNLQLVAGKAFKADESQVHEKFLIVNESFLKKFNLGNAPEAIGETVIVGDSTLLSITGVVKDFLYKPAEYSLDALMLRYDPSALRFLNVRIHQGNITNTVASLESTWKTFDPDHAFDGRFYDDEIERAFADFNDTIFFVSFITFLGIVITCLGLLGITIFTIQSKAKEITIRKIFGASHFTIFKFLSKSYLRIMLISILVGSPVIFLLADQFLQLYNNRIPLSPVLLLPGFLLVFMITALTVSSQTIKAAVANPVKSLRTE